MLGCAFKSLAINPPCWIGSFECSRRREGKPVEQEEQGEARALASEFQTNTFEAMQRPFRIASADCMETIFLPPLVQRLRQQVPGAQVIVRGIDASFDYAEALERDHLDAVICNWPGAPGHLKTAHLMTEDIVCLMGAQHPLAGRRSLSIEEYLSADHIAPVARSRADPGPIDLQLAERGLRRRIQTMVAEFNLIPHMLLSSDLIFTSSARFAGYFTSLMPLHWAPAPAEFGTLKFFLLWHERAHSDARNIWLRSHDATIS